MPGPITLRGGHTTADPRLDRLPHFDERSRNYTVRELLESMPAFKGKRGEKGRAHLPGPTLNQQREGQCVSEAVHDAANGSPNRLKPAVTDFAVRRDAYHQMQHRDPWAGCYLGGSCPVQPVPGGEYGGTSVLAGMMYGRDRGYWREVRWIGAGSGRLEDDVIDTLRQVGGIVFGIPWHEGMYETNPDGLVSIDGNEVGGHAIHGWEWVPRLRLPRSFEGTKPAVAWHNSWGDDYGTRRRGVTGVGYILLDDLLQLLERGGEGAVPLA